MAQNTEEEVKALKARLKAAQDRLKAERFEAARIKRAEERAVLLRKVDEFREETATEVIGDYDEWIDVYSNTMGTEVTIYAYATAQMSFHLNIHDAKKLRDVLNETYPS